MSPRRRSLLTPKRPIWTLANLDDLKGRFVEVPVQGAQSFEDKLRQQLEGASDEVKQLAAEVVCVHYVVAADISKNKKVEAVGTVLGWMEASVAVAANVAEAFRIGLIGAGQGYRQFKPNQMWLRSTIAVDTMGRLSPLRRGGHQQPQCGCHTTSVR